MRYAKAVTDERAKYRQEQKPSTMGAQPHAQQTVHSWISFHDPRHPYGPVNSAETLIDYAAQRMAAR